MTALLEAEPKQPAAPAVRRNLPSLTGMRWAAALMVFGTHIRIVGYFGPPASHTVQTLLYPGISGVSFFFILSGFVLAWTARDNDRPRAFWHRRFARIYPVHLATAAVTLVLTCTIMTESRPGVPQLISNLALVHSWPDSASYYQSLNTVSWSLSCEAFFYLLFPFILLAVRRLSPMWLGGLVVAAIGITMALPVLADHDPLAPLDFLPLARLPEFVIGVAMGRLLQLRRWHGPGVRLSLLIVAAGYFLTDNVPIPYRYTSCTVIGFTLLIAAGATADLRERPTWWRSKLMVRLGEISFCFYMVHLLVIRVGERVYAYHPLLSVWPAIGVSLAAFTVAFVLAWAAHTYIEKPAQRLVLGKRKPARRPDPAAATP